MSFDLTILGWKRKDFDAIEEREESFDLTILGWKL